MCAHLYIYIIAYAIANSKGFSGFFIKNVLKGAKWENYILVAGNLYSNLSYIWNINNILLL